VKVRRQLWRQQSMAKLLLQIAESGPPSGRCRPRRHLAAGNSKRPRQAVWPGGPGAPGRTRGPIHVHEGRRRKTNSLHGGDWGRCQATRTSTCICRQSRWASLRARPIKRPKPQAFSMHKNRAQIGTAPAAPRRGRGPGSIDPTPAWPPPLAGRYQHPNTVGPTPIASCAPIRPCVRQIESAATHQAGPSLAVGWRGATNFFPERQKGPPPGFPRSGGAGRSRAERGWRYVGGLFSGLFSQIPPPIVSDRRASEAARRTQEASGRLDR